MVIFNNHQLKNNFLTFWIIGFIYLISISQISSNNLPKAILSKNKSYFTNNTISTFLNITNDEKKSKRKANSNYPNQNNYNYGYDYNYTSENNTYNSTNNQTKGFEVYPGAFFFSGFLFFL
jgi:hypothetical protein